MLVHYKNRQKGSLGGYMLAILLFGGLFTIASRLVPIYIDHNTIINILDKMQYERTLSEKTDSELMEIMRKRFRLNNLRNFPINEHVEFKRSSAGVNLVLDYEVRVALISNLDVVASFSEEIELNY